MCNACGNVCCGSDMFSGCGCDGCYCEDCWSDDEDDGEFRCEPVDVGDELHQILGAALKSGGPTVTDPDRPTCKPDGSCCDFVCGN